MGDYAILSEALLKFRDCFSKKLIDVRVIENSKVFLHSLTQKQYTLWTYNEAYRLYEIMRPYQSKLKMVGFDFSTIPKVTLTPVKKTEVTAQSRVIGYNGTHFIIMFPYSLPVYEAVKKIPGRVYDNEKKYWTAPLASSSYIKQFAMGYNFDLGETAYGMINNVSDNLENSYSAEYIELNLPVKGTFMPFQTVSVDYGMKNKRIICADQMGLGKTITGIGVAVGAKKPPILVICPKTLRLNWKDEFEKWTDYRCIILDKKNASRLKHLIENDLVDVVITNYDGVQTFFVSEIKEVQITQGARKGSTYDLVKTNGLEQLFKTVIADEAHHCRNTRTTRFKAVKKCFEDKDIRVCLTGTPVVKSPQDLAALLELIGRIDEFGGRYKFLQTYRDMDKRFNSITDNAKMSAQLQELNIKLRSLCFIRREKHQVLKELPDKFRKIIRVPLENRKEYDHALHNFEVWLNSQNMPPEKVLSAMNAQVLVQYGILKQLTAKGKFTAVKEFAEEVIESGEKLILVCWYNETVAALKAVFPNAVTISGMINGRQTKDEEIQEAKIKFQTDPNTKIIIITYGKGGEGHTLTAASKVGFIELGWTYKDQAQAEDRAHRIGQKSDVECYYFLGEDTVDEGIYKIIDVRRRLEKETTGGQEETDTTITALTKELFKGIEFKAKVS